MEGEPRFPVCVFLVPIVRDRDRTPHQPIVWRLLQDVLVRTFGAGTGPQTVVCYRTEEAIPGAWSPGEGEEPVEDLSRKYTVAVPAHRIEEFQAFVRKVGNSFDQRAMYCEIAGYAEILEVRPEDGFL